MARIKQRKLRWTGSESPQVVGYKLYWEEGGHVTYDSSCASLGNVTEIVLPDDVEAFSPEPGIGPIEFGVTAVDELGNESDLITLSAPYQFNVPQAPDGIWLEDPDTSSQEECAMDTSDTDPLAFLDHDLDDQDGADDEAIIHRLPDNVVGNHSSENQQDMRIALKRQVDKL